MTQPGIAPDQIPAGKEVATLAGGCFWCLEAVYDDLRGVESVESGYMGGAGDQPTYEQVCSGTSGHVRSIECDGIVVSLLDAANLLSLQS